MVEMIEGLLIDEEKKYVLTKYRKTKKGVQIRQSDHNSLVTSVRATWHKKIKVTPTSMYNIRDKDGLKKIHKMTSRDTFLSEVLMMKTRKLR